jgi:hypothetical protein
MTPTEIQAAAIEENDQHHRRIRREIESFQDQQKAHNDYLNEIEIRHKYNLDFVRGRCIRFGNHTLSTGQNTCIHCGGV